MSAFTESEIEFVVAQRLGRLATVGADGTPHVVPVAVFYDRREDALVIGANADFGDDVMVKSKKVRDAQRRPRVAVVVDIPSPRVLEVRGDAETHTQGGAEVGQRVGAPFRFGPAYLLIRPRRVVYMGLDDGAYESYGRDIT